MQNDKFLPQRRQARRAQAGFAMAETILAVALGAVALVGLGRMMAEGQRDLRSRNVAQQQAAFMNAAGNYYIANESAILLAMKDGTNANQHCVVQANPTTGAGGTVANDLVRHTCAFDVDWLKWKKALPETFKASNIHGQRWVAIFKRVYEAGVETDAAEMLTVAADVGGTAVQVTSLDELNATAELVGGSGGYVPDKDRVVCKHSAAANTYQACGTQGGWKVDLKQFVSTL